MMRIVMLVLVALGLLTLLAVVQLGLGAWQLTIDVPALVVLYLVLSEAPRERGAWRPGRPRAVTSLDLRGVLLVLVLGYLNDVLAALPKGSSSLVLAGVYLVAGSLVRWVDVRGAVREALAGAVASLLASTLGLALRALAGLSADARLVWVLLGQAALTAAAAPLVMRLLATVGEPTGPAAGTLRARPF